MNEPRQVDGVVVSGGVPFEGAYVRISGPSGEFVSERRTGADGSFRVYLPPGTWSIVAFGPGTGRVTTEMRVEAGQDARVTVDLGGA